MPQVALAWLRGRRGVNSIVLGARNTEQLADNLASIHLKLTPEQISHIERAGRPRPIYPSGIARCGRWTAHTIRAGLS